jgi:Protein of unknown function (DUF3592)
MDRQEQFAEILRTWKSPAELAGPLPRPVRLAGPGGVLAFAVAILFIVGTVTGVAVGLQARAEAQFQRRLRKEGIPASAVITRLWQTSGRHTLEKVSYRFNFNGVTYGGESSAPRKLWRELRTGSNLPIVFLPSAPGISQPNDWPNPATPIWLAFLPGILLPSLGVLLLTPIFQQRRLLAEGRAAPAIVTGVRRPRNRVVVDYDFTLPAGAVMQAKGGQPRNYPNIGDTICVLYDPTDPHRNAPYPLPLVNPAKRRSWGGPDTVG